MKYRNVMNLYQYYSDPKQLPQFETMLPMLYFNRKDVAYDSDDQDMTTPQDALERLKNDADEAYWFVNKMMKGKRYPPLEGVISKVSHVAWYYANDIVKGEWKEGEDAIAKDAATSLQYARLINKRFKKGEDIILKTPKKTYDYIKYVIKQPWKKGESVLATHSYYAYEYASKILKGRFPEGEAAIMENPYNALLYAENVIRGRWKDAESEIAKDESVHSEYQRFLSGEDDF